MTVSPGAEPIPLRKAVHADTGAETGAGGHVAAPTDINPALRRQADAIEADAAGAVTVSVQWGFFRADPVTWPAGTTPSHWEASTAAGLRQMLCRAGILPAGQAAQ